MKSRIIYFILLLAGTFYAKAQTWMPVGSGITGTDVNTTWALCAYDSVLYAGGWFNTAGGITVNDIAQWNGSTWDSTGTGTDGFISAMAVYKGDLYAGGQFNTIGGVAASDIARWNGSHWMPVGKGLTGGDYGVYALAVYNGILYAGGNFDSAGGEAISAIAQWNDTNWSKVGTGIELTDEDEGVFALSVYEGKLYIGGNFAVSGGTNVADWNGSLLYGVGGGTIGAVYALAVYNDNLYVGGMITMAGAVESNCIAVWNNVTWSTIDSGITGENGWSTINALTVYNNDLYIGGFFDTVNGARINCITKWNGSHWSSVGSGINVGGAIDAMQVFNGSLYVAGGFDSAGGVYAKNIAMLTSSTSINELSTNNGIAIYPNPANSYLIITTGYFDNTRIYTLYNLLGQQVTTGSLHLKTNTLNLENLPSGTYILAVKTEGKQYNYKFIKE